MMDCLLSRENMLGMKDLADLPRTKASLVSILKAIEHGNRNAEFVNEWTKVSSEPKIAISLNGNMTMLCLLKKRKITLSQKSRPISAQSKDREQHTWAEDNFAISTF